MADTSTRWRGCGTRRSSFAPLSNPDCVAPCAEFMAPGPDNDLSLLALWGLFLVGLVVAFSPVSMEIKRHIKYRLQCSCVLGINIYTVLYLHVCPSVNYGSMHVY